MENDNRALVVNHFMWVKYIWHLHIHIDSQKLQCMHSF
jgi:hypothetical protein